MNLLFLYYPHIPSYFYQTRSFEQTIGRYTMRAKTCNSIGFQVFLNLAYDSFSLFLSLLLEKTGFKLSQIMMLNKKCEHNLIVKLVHLLRESVYAKAIEQ